ncbi:succinate dehydrogenase/fumarate reductase iron-sulfur subunit [Thermocrinis sp.]
MRISLRLYRDNAFLVKEFEIETSQTVLDALYRIKEEQDPTLSFRSMCKAGICGTCGVKVNGKPVLACKTKIEELEEPILIEPLDNLPVIRDLVVSHDVLLDRIKRLRAWYEPLEYNLPTFKPSALIDKSFNCIACGLCDSFCPVFITNAEFGGPMAFSRLCKLFQDPRNLGREEVPLRIKDGHINLCTHCRNCSMVCPAEVMPETLIKMEEGELLRRGLLSQSTPNSFDFF